MDHMDVVVVGAGVVGLAIAREMAQLGKSVLVIEKEKSFGMSTSSRNSEVIHAGIYYRQNSLKAKYCVEGNRLLYAYAKARAIPFNPCGKLIVATSEQELQELERIWQQGQNNGVPGLHQKTQSQLSVMEPALKALEAIYSETTGVIDSHTLMLSYVGDIENAGGLLSYHTKLLGVERASSQGRFEVNIAMEEQMDASYTMSCDELINCAGLSSVDVARQMKGFDLGLIPEPYFVKGNYFSLAGKTPFQHLIYPIPEKVGLGVHLTLDLNGRAKFGPDVEHIDVTMENEINYSVDPNRTTHFEQQIRQYWPELPIDMLSPDYSGVRPKIKIAGQVWPDFKIDFEEQHHIPGLVNLYGIESPGLTASLAIAKSVGETLKK